MTVLQGWHVNRPEMWWQKQPLRHLYNSLKSRWSWRLSEQTRAPYLGWHTWQRGWSTAAGDGHVRKPLFSGGWVRLSTGGHLNWDYHSPGTKATTENTIKSAADFWNRSVKSLQQTWAEGPGEAVGEGHEPSGREKWAMKTMSLAKAPRTSALGHSSRYSEKRLGYANKTLCANQKRTFLLCLSRMQRASYLEENTKKYS